MKYSIFQYSQEKLLEYNLDVIDALILSWFSDFFVGSMEKRIFKDESNNTGKLFGWVKLSKVMEDLPCIGINSEKGIKRRFDNFVEKGILERKSLITQNGKKTYYTATEVYETLINTKIREHNQNGKEERPHDYQNIHAENKKSHRTKTTNADLKTLQKTSHDYQNIYADGNKNILAHDYQNIYALNYSAINDHITTDAAIIKSETEKIFGINYFDSNFPGKAADFLTSKNINKKDWSLYLNYIYSKLHEKNAKNPRGLAYKLFFQTDVLQEFETQRQQTLLFEEKQKKQKQEEELRIKICPACGKNFDSLGTECCPDCNFSIEDFNDIKKIEKQKKFNKLSQKEKDSYISEFLNFKVDMNSFEKIKFFASEEGQKQREDYINELDKKYGLVS